MSTVHSERLGADLHLGKLPATTPRSGTVLYTDLRPGLAKAGVLPTMPQMFGHGHDFPQGSWLMLGNGPDDTVFPGFQGAGDCTIAGAAHEVMEAQKNTGRPVSPFSGATTIRQYSERTKAANGEAYDPHTGAGDTGLNIQDVNEWRLEEGIADDTGTRHKILDPISIEAGNIQHLWEASWLFEKVGLGIVVCQAQMDQFDSGTQPTWDYVPGSSEEGGHYVPQVGKLGVISWAEDVYYTPRFLEHQNDEAWATIEPEQFSSVTGETLEHFHQADLEKYAVLLAQKKAIA